MPPVFPGFSAVLRRADAPELWSTGGVLAGCSAPVAGTRAAVLVQLQPAACSLTACILTCAGKRFLLGPRCMCSPGLTHGNGHFSGATKQRDPSGSVSPHPLNQGGDHSDCKSQRIPTPATAPPRRSPVVDGPEWSSTRVTRDPPQGCHPPSSAGYAQMEHRGLVSPAPSPFHSFPGMR